MKIRLLTLGFLVSCSLLASADDQRIRDYWPTSGWKLSKPENQEMLSSHLKKMSAFVKGNLPNASNITVIRHGYIVFEENYLGDSTTLRPVASVAKSVLSALIGIAIRDGYIKSIDQRMVDFFPKLKKNKSNPEVDNIQIRHLLTLSDGISKNASGIDFSRFDPTQELRASPGKELFYNDMSPQVLSMILTDKTGLKALDFAKKYLLGPLGIGNVTWEEVNGYSIGASGLQLTTRDLAKIGYLYLNKGKWEGKQLIPENWVIESTRSQIDAPNVPYFNIKFTYGFLWWLHSVGKYSAFSAVGWGGQYITVVPEIDFVVVITTVERMHSNAPKYLALIEDYVLPSIMR